MSKSIFPLACAALLLLWMTKVVLYPDNTDESTRQAMKDAIEKYVEQGRVAVNEYVEVVEGSVERSLRKLFEELDSDHDGCIKKDEFRGVSVGLIAAMSSVKMPSLLNLTAPSLPTLETSVPILRVWIGGQFLFLCLLFVVEHVRVFFGLSSAKPFGSAKRNPPVAGKDRALFYDTPMTTYERIKMLFFALSGLLVLRMLLTFVCFFIAVMFINLSVFQGRNRHNSPVWFAFCAAGVKLFGALLLASMGFYHVKVEGKLASRRECKILVGNHICMVELVFLYLSADFPAFVSRVENLTVPLFRGVVAASDAIVVDRDAASSRTKTLGEIKKRSKDSNAAQLMIFPEGTCNNQLSLFQFRKGAFEPGESVQPVCFYFAYDHFNPAWTGRACGGNDLLDLLLRLWSQFVNRLEVKILPVHVATKEERECSLTYANNIQRIMAETIGLSTSDATYADYQQAARVYNKGTVVNAEGRTPSPSLQALDLHDR